MSQVLPDEESKKKRCGTPHLLTEFKNRILNNRYYFNLPGVSAGYAF